jgi:hypothetical protein
MSLKKRLNKLERKLHQEGDLWVIFLIRYYENPEETERVKGHLLKHYLSNGNSLPTHQVFIQDAGSCQEGFHTSFLVC